MTTNPLPFDLSNDSASAWLQSLSQLNSVNSANQLNQVAKQLSRIKTDAENRLAILKQLTPTTLYICSDIESSLQTEANSRFDKSQKIQKLCIQLLRNLSLGFYVLSITRQLTDKERNQALYMTLQLIGYSQRLSAIFHLAPSSTLWKITGELYTLAQNKHITQKEIKHKIKAFKKLATIESILKRNLLFSLVAPYKYSTTQIDTLFLISEQYAHLLSLNTADTLRCGFYWDYSSQTPPEIKQPYQPAGITFIYIDTHAITSKLQSTAFSSHLEKETLEQITNQLTGCEKVINSPLPATFSVNHLVTGIVDITKYLSQINQLNKIQQLSAEINDDDSTTVIAKMSLEPMEFEKNQCQKIPPFSCNTNYLLSETTTIKTLSLKDERFIIAESNPIDSSIGDIALLCSSRPHPTLGIIRQIKIINPTGTQHILIEKVVGIPSLQKIFQSKAPEQPAILIQHKNTSASVFITPCKLPNDARIQLAIGNSTTLKALIDHTPFYMQYLV